MSLNIPNLDKLIAHLEAQPPERINMGWSTVKDYGCGTCGCIIGHAQLLWPEKFRFAWDAELAPVLGFNDDITDLTRPDGWEREDYGVKRYPAHRVIATLKRLRDHYLAAGEIVVDWGPEPGAEPVGLPWSAPRVVAIDPPALPVELTRLLASQPADLAQGA